MEIRNGLRKTFPKGVKPTPHRHDVLAAIWGISSLCVISAKRGHGLYVISAVDGDELFGNYFYIFLYYLYVYPLFQLCTVHLVLILLSSSNSISLTYS